MPPCPHPFHGPCFLTVCREPGKPQTTLDYEQSSIFPEGNVSPFLAWGDFHAHSRFARSTIGKYFMAKCHIHDKPTMPCDNAFALLSLSQSRQGSTSCMRNLRLWPPFIHEVTMPAHQILQPACRLQTLLQKLERKFMVYRGDLRWLVQRKLQIQILCLGQVTKGNP